MVKIWLDDIRDPKDPNVQQIFCSTPDMIWAKNIEIVKHLIRTGVVNFISFDHDMGQDENGKERASGYNLAIWIQNMILSQKIKRIKWQVHSMNPSGSKNISCQMQINDKLWEAIEGTNPN